LAEGNPTTWVEFELNRDGKLLRTSLFRSSGYEVLDAAALQTFARAQPFPRIPAGMENQIILIMGFDFNVSLNQ
jgi:protein TonB